MARPASDSKDHVPAAARPELFKEGGDNPHVVPLIATVDIGGPIVTKKELSAYYLYANGNNGVLIGYSMTLFQALATAAAYDAKLGPGNPCSPGTPSGACVLPWGSGGKSVSSVVLIANGAAFALASVLFTIMGSAADYGTFGRWFLLTVTFVLWGTQFASMALTSPNRWGAAMVLYIFGFVSYSATYVFFYALFPRLARNTAHTREQRRRYEKGEIPVEEFELAESLEKNRICNIGIANSTIGYSAALLLNLAILIPLAQNPKVDNYTLVLTGAYGVVTGIWWFIYQQPRPGPPLPKGESYWTIGFKQIWEACKQYKKLPYTFIYILAYFFLADGFNTTFTLVRICQNDVIRFSFLQNTYFSLAQSLSSILSTFGLWYIQKSWKISTKKLFVLTNIVTILVPFWGMLGIWTNKIGFHNVWEYWAYHVIYGLLQVPTYAYAQTMLAELTPPGFDSMFFALFGLTVRASSIIGPNVIQAIINRTRNNWQGYPFLFALCLVPSPFIWFGVDIQKGRRHAVLFADEKRRMKTGAADADASSESAGSTKL